MRELILTASENNWRLFMVRKEDPAFFPFQEKVWKRDHYTCQYCGFCAKLHLEVVNQNLDFHDNAIKNLITACPLCAQCFFLESIDKAGFGGGSLIFFPEMKQQELNALCHVLFTSLISGGGGLIQAKNIYRSLRLRSQPIEKELGESMSHPDIYGQLLVNMKKESHLKFHQQLMTSIKLLPDVLKFANKVVDWVGD